MAKRVILSLFIMLLCISEANAIKLWPFSKKTAQKITYPKLEIYNKVPEAPRIDLKQLRSKRYYISTGVVSPDKSKVGYTEVYYYPFNNQINSRAYYFELLDDEEKVHPYDTKKVLEVKNKYKANKVIIESGTTLFEKQSFKALSIIDWSEDSTKLLIKESCGENQRSIIGTNIWVYDFEKEKAKRLDEVRIAISNFWKEKYNIDLNNYMWDIIPLGFDVDRNHQIVLKCYGYNQDKKIFLGSWAVNHDGSQVELLSLKQTIREVGKYGYILPSIGK